MKAVDLIKNVTKDSDTTTLITHEGLSSIIHIKHGASSEELKLLEAYKNDLPEVYLSLLIAFNGFDLFRIEDIGGFHFFSCGELVRNNEFQALNYADEWDKDLVLICSLIGEGDFIGLRILETDYQLLDCFHEESPKEWKIIGNSIDDFIENVIKEKGKKFWL